METWCERWNIKINEDKTRGIYFSRSRRPPESHLIPFVNSVKYLSVIFDKRVTWRLHIGMIEAKAFRTFIRIYSLFKCERLSTNNKRTIQKALFRSIWLMLVPPGSLQQTTIYWNCSARQKKSSRHYLKFSKVHIGPRFAHGFQTSLHIPYGYITKLCRKLSEVIQNNENANVRNIGQGEPRPRKYKRLKLVGDQAYGRSSD
jgi:hypothetical protein